MPAIQSALLLVLSKYEKDLVTGSRCLRVRKGAVKTLPANQRMGKKAARLIERLKENNIPFALETGPGEGLGHCKLVFPDFETAINADRPARSQSF